MIAKKYRTPKESIPYILKKGEQSQSALFIIRYIKNNEQFSRCRVIISKKLEPKAVKRNYLRRQVYEAVRQNQSEEGQKNKNSLDRIFIPKKRIISATYQQIVNDLKSWTN